MMTNKQITAIYNGLVGKYGEREAYERFLEKHPDAEGELNLLVTEGLPEEDPSLRQGFTDVEELMALPEADDEEGELDVSLLAGDEMLDDEDTPLPTRATPAKADKPAAAPAPKAPKAAAPAADKAPSKTEQALAIYTAATDKSRKAIIAAFKAQLAMTDAGAATYLQNIRKKKAGV